MEPYDWGLLTHAAYSPELTPPDYHLFGSMRHELSEQRFNIRQWLDDYFAAKNGPFWRGIYILSEMENFVKPILRNKRVSFAKKINRFKCIFDIELCKGQVKLPLTRCGITNSITEFVF